jgi:signal transduction histidine kinase
MRAPALARPLSAWLLPALTAALLTVALGGWAWWWPALAAPVPSRAWAAAAIGCGLLGLLALGMAWRRARAQQRLRRQVQQQARNETDRLEALVQQRTAELEKLAQHLQTAREDERHRLARDLHDELGALLTSAKLDVARIRPRLAAADPHGDALQRLQHLGGTLDQVIALTRRIAEDLRPSSLAHLGLVPTLEILARDFARTKGITVHGALQPVPLGPAAELTAYRVVQESLTNVGKHAGASQVWLTLRTQDGQALLAVRDDGRGFDSRAARSSAHGLVGMRCRVQAERGLLRVDSQPGRGTHIAVTLPLLQPVDAAGARVGQGADAGGQRAR